VMLRRRLDRLSSRPKMSVVMTVCNPSPELLDRAIESVVGQVYDRWELCVVDDASGREVISTLNEWAARDNRIRVTFRHVSVGVDLATGTAVQMATGEFLVFVEGDDEMSPDALGEIALYLDENPGLKVVFTDADKIDRNGGRYCTETEPDFCPEVSRGQTGLRHLMVVRPDVIRGVDGRARLQGAIDSGLARILSDSAGQGHIAKILYHERDYPKPIRVSENARVADIDANRASIQEFPFRRAMAPQVFEPDLVADTPIRALMAGVNLNLEGAPYDQLEMTAGLRDLGIIDPVVYSPIDGPLRDEYIRRGIEVHVFPHPLEPVLFTSAGYSLGIQGFARWIHSMDVEVVYGNTLTAFYAIAAAKELDLPSIWNPRESEPWQSYFKSYGPYVAGRALECFSYPYRVVFTAHASEQVYGALNTHLNFTTIHDGLDRGRFDELLGAWPRDKARKALGIAEDEVMVLMVGTVCERKGQLDLVQAVGKLSGSKASNSLRSFIVGDRSSDYSRELVAAHSRMKQSVQSRVKVIPETIDVFMYYAAADIYLCCSRSESFPRVILEAMAAGLPIVTTPVHGIVEQVREGKNAMFFQPGDVEALAKKLATLIDDEDLRGQMGANSKLQIDSLIDYDSMVKAYGAVFQKAWLSGRSRGQGSRRS
ncbi:MAG TPA: glycosyltransferase, partial [Blastocatellia bacterium]|nr:glycosyltransferase [Blastocatellia bacterium]